MALVKCPECGREKVSDTAVACPDCGYAIKEYYDKLKYEEEQKLLQEKLAREEEERKKQALIEAKRREEKEKIEREEAEKKRIQLEKERKIRNKKIGIVVAVIAFIVFIGIIIKNVIIPANEYSQAVERLEKGEYDIAKKMFETLGDYKDSEDLVLETCYQKAQYLVEEKDYQGAIDILVKNSDYKKSLEVINECKYQIALLHYEKEEYDDALNILNTLGNYNNSTQLVNEISYIQANQMIEAGEYLAAYYLLVQISGYNDSDTKAQSILNEHVNDIYLVAVEEFNLQKYEHALKIFKLIEQYSDVNDYIEKINLYSRIQGTWEWKFQDVTSKMVFNGLSLTHTYLGQFQNQQTDFDLFFEKYNDKWSLTYKYTKYGITSQEWFWCNGNSMYRYQTEGNSFIYNKVSGNITVDKLQEPRIGMTGEEVKNLSTWGAPEDINKTTTGSIIYEQWCYSDYRYIYLENGIVTSISE